MCIRIRITESLLDPDPGEKQLSNLCVFPVGGVHDGSTAHLGYLLPVAIETPAADLVRSYATITQNFTVCHYISDSAPGGS